MQPSDRYQQLISQPGFVSDASQVAAVEMLDELLTRLGTREEASLWQRLLSRQPARPAGRGLYFWGGVGRGKTMLMDLFYQSLPGDIRGQRSHFHRFMNEVHAALKDLKGQQEPLSLVASAIADRVDVLCLDEFVIIDIGDAMIMAGLLETLFARGVILVTTSNARPADLYRDGLQRARFLPAISLLEQHCQVVNLDGGEDYRLRYLQQTNLYMMPHGDDSIQAIQSYLAEHVKPFQQSTDSLLINDRTLQPEYCGEDCVWFNFEAICKTERSQDDYLELSRLFNTIIVSEIPVMNADSDDAARRFVLLIDVLYDHHVKLICSAAANPHHLYQGKRLAFEFERTASRLIEMQSDAYLEQGHQPL